MNKFKITIDGNNYDVTVNLTDHHKANVEVKYGCSSYPQIDSSRYPTGTCFSTGCCSIQCHQYQSSASRNDHDHQRKSR